MCGRGDPNSRLDSGGNTNESTPTTSPNRSEIENAAPQQEIEFSNYAGHYFPQQQQAAEEAEFSNYGK